MLDEQSVLEKTREFLDRFGEKGYIVLKTAVEVALDPSIDHKYGDFSYKHLVFRLQRMGVGYSPHNLLRILEKEYGLIEKTYISTTQKWWRFVDIDAVRRALLEYSGISEIDDPRAKLLAVKYRALEPHAILNMLRRLLAKDKLSQADKEVFKRIVFGDLEVLVNLYTEMASYEDVFREELRVLEEILALADMVSRKIGALAGIKPISGKRVRVEQQVLSEVEEIEENSAEPW